MTFPAANVRIKAGPLRLFAKSRHLDAPLEGRRNRAGHLAAQAHKFAGVGPVNGWNWAGIAQGPPPGCTEQAAFFMVTTAIIVAVEVFTFRTSRGFHIFKRPAVNN